MPKSNLVLLRERVEERQLRGIKCVTREDRTHEPAVVVDDIQHSHTKRGAR